MVIGIGLFALLLQQSGSAYAAGDPVRGRQLSAQCFACHGVDGNSPSPVNPKLGGQHEQYLLLALKAYADGARPNSLMSGAVLDKSEQDLQDMAAYFAGQSGSAPGSGPPGSGQPGAGKPGPGPGGPGGPRGRGGPAMNFDHGERDSEFTSMLARAEALNEHRAAGADLSTACIAFDATAPESRDSDNDGLADRWDAAPNDAGEFVTDTNGDGWYEICSIRQLQAIATLGSGDGASTGLSVEARRARSYQLAVDVDAAGILFEPIGNCGPTGNCMRALGQFGFAGVFDGRGHIIRNLRIDAAERGGVGLFGVLAPSGVVMNLDLENSSVVGRGGVGTIVGSNFGTVYRCHAIGLVEGAMAIGGLVGGSGGLVYDSKFSGQVRGKQAVGGLVGDMTGAVYQSATVVEIGGDRGIGGLVGLSTFGSILDSYANATVSGANDIGGLVGVNTDAKVRNSYAIGRVDGSSNNIGGLVGFNSQSSVRNTYATGEVSGVEAVGGLIGRNKGFVGNSYATGDVSGTGSTGALVGFVVEGEIVGDFTSKGPEAKDIRRLTGMSSGWAPEVLPVAKPLQYFCDLNRDGFIGPAERTVDNYIWDFGGEGDDPAVRCAAGGIDNQRR